MPTLIVRTPEGLTLHADIAGGGSRFGAAVIDGVFFGLAYLAVMFAVALLAQVDPSGLGNAAMGMLAIGQVLLFVVYQAVFLALWNGQTPGKRAFGLRVTSSDGYPVRAMQVGLRSLLWPIDVLVPFLGLLVITLTERRQRLGDLVGGTIVLRERPAAAQEEPFAGQSWSTLEVKTLPLAPGFAAKLGQEDLEFLRDLWAREGIEADAKRKLFISAAKFYCARLGVASFDDARVVLREVFLFAREMRSRP